MNSPISGSERSEMNQIYEELARRFERNTAFCHLHPYDLYREWLEGISAFLDVYQEPEKFRTKMARYNAEQGAEFGHLLVLYSQCVEEYPFRDILGELFMRLDINSVNAGQFFTPGTIAEMMARMNFDPDAFKRLVEEKGEVTVCDPAVGSGVMLLCYAKVVNDTFGRWGTDRLRLYGQDIDPRCVAMCRIQLGMNGLDGIWRGIALAGACSAPRERVPGQLVLPGLAEWRVA